MVTPVPLVLLVVMLFRFREARPAVLAGWAASLPPFAGLSLLAYHYSCSPVTG